MGWEKCRHRGRGSRVSIGVSKIAEYRALVIYVAGDVLECAGMEPLQKVSVLWGDGFDQGWVRLEPGDDVKLSQAHRGAKLTTSRVPTQARLVHHSSTPCEWRIRDGGIEIETPPWLWGDDKKNLSTGFVHKSGDNVAAPAKYQS